MVPPLTLLGPQSRFGDKTLGIRVVCPQKRHCSPKRVEVLKGLRNTSTYHSGRKRKEHKDRLVSISKPKQCYEAYIG